MYIHNIAMAELRKCSRCRSVIELTYLCINGKGEPYKTCDACRNKKKQLKGKQEGNYIASTRTLDTIEDDKYIIVMDVETNGSIKTRNAQPTPNNISQFPHIVQFS